MLRMLSVISFSFVLVACSEPKYVGLDEAYEKLEQNYVRSGYLSFTDILSENNESREAVEKFVRKKQCIFNRANPALILALREYTLTLKGIFSKDGSFKISAGQTPGIELGFGRRTDTEQTIEVPVRVVALGAMPDEYLKLKLHSLDIAHMPEKSREELNESILNDYRKLEKRVEELMRSFDSQKHCPKTDISETKGPPS